ncbi:nickel-dependent lactate racemase [Chloroflexota bacterium]
MKEIKLLSAAWYQDEQITLEFPDSWDITVLGDQILPELPHTLIKEQIENPIGSETLNQLAKNRARAVIIVDDLTRPTPADILIDVVLVELANAGIPNEAITIIVGGGAHKPATGDDIRRKLGPNIPSSIRVKPHNSHEDHIFLGTTSKGTPLYINREVYESDLKIGVGCIYPHPAAGFSGGSKILVPGVAGYKTIQYLHDHLRGADHRAGSLDTEFRNEIEQIATQVHLDFIVNVVLNQQRQITAVFAGDKNIAHRQGVDFASKQYHVQPVNGADIIIADMYPFDADLQFAYDRGFWPLHQAKRDASKIVLAACPIGVGDHELFPLESAVQARISRRLRNFKMRDLKTLPYRIQSGRNMVKKKSLDFMMLTQGISEEELRPIFPNGKIYHQWNNLLLELKHRHTKPPVKVTVYKCAPFLIDL